MKKFKKDSNSLKDYFFSHFGMTKRQRSGFFSLILLLIISELIIQFYTFQGNQPVEQIAFTPSEEALLLKEENNENNTPEFLIDEVNLSTFNPNSLDVQGFMELGFSEKQANSLIKYRYSVGGNFKSVDEFGAAYVMSERMFEKLKPHIELKPFAANLINKNSGISGHQNNFAESNKRNSQLKPFDPNKLTAEGWLGLGFSERQVEVILNYKKSLSNRRFENLEQIKSCFVINDYMFNKIKPYVRLQPLVENQKTIADENKANQHFELIPNKMSADDWMALGWDESSASNIIKYKEFIGGFHSLEDLEKCKYISEDQLEKIRNRVIFE